MFNFIIVVWWPIIYRIFTSHNFYVGSFVYVGYFFVYMNFGCDYDAKE